MKKKLHLKQSVKNLLDYTLILAIFTIGIYVSIQSITIRQTKMTEISGTYISQNK